MRAVAGISLGLLLVAATLCVWRALRPGSIGDRALGLDSLVSLVVCGLAVGVVATGDDVFIDVALVAGLLGFLGTTTVARYVGRRGL